jgi:hypothetical protein
MPPVNEVMKPDDREVSGAEERTQARAGSHGDAAGTGRTAWEVWAERELADADKRGAAVDAAAAALLLGASPIAAAVAARLNAGTKVPAGEVRALWEELQTLDRVAVELRTVRPSGDLTEAGLAELNRQYQARFQAVRDIYALAVGAVTDGSVKAAGAVAGSPAASPPGPSMREFFADNSIVIISIAGAFLLIVATLLFEIYGTTGFGGEVRFTGVLALNLSFGVAGYLCLGRSRLRLVGQTYLAIFALMAPLTVAAAWVFLTLESRGISREFALGVGGLGCSILYAVLALRLGSRGYAALSMVALAAGWTGLLGWANAGIWMGAWLTVLVFTYIAIAYPPARSPRQTRVFTELAEPFIHGAALVILYWALTEAASEWNLEFIPQPRPSYQLATTFGLLSVAYVLYAWRSRRSWMLWAAWTGASLAVLATVGPLGFGQRGYLVDLAVLAWAYAIGARWMRNRRLRAFVRCGAAVQAAIPILLSASPVGLPAIVLLATSGIGVLFAIELDEPAWLLLAAAVFSVDWFWLAKSLLPPPPNPTADTLILTYSPLPVLYALAGLGLRLTRGRRWAWPLYAAAGLVALGVAISATAQGDLTLAGRALIVYAGVAYVAAAVDRWWPGLLAAMFAAAASVILLLGAAASATYWYPLAMTALAVALYGAHLAWGESALARTHRFGAIAIVGLTAASSFAVPDFWQQASLGSIAALLALIVTAALVLADGRRYSRPLLDYAAPAIASLGGFWIARYLGVDNVQAYVALPGIVLMALGLTAPQDQRRPASLALCRAAIVVGAMGLMGASAFQSVTEDAAASYTTLWMVEAVLAMLVGIGARSRTLVLAGSAGLAFGALRALFLILESVQVYVVFGVIALLLLIAAGVLAATRDRLAAARTSVTRSWGDWK